MTFLARGTMKMTSKNAAGVQTLTKSTLEARVTTGLSTLIRAEAKHYYPNIKQNIACEITANYLMEYIVRYVPDNRPGQNMWDFLTGSLDALEAGYSYLIVYALINVMMIRENGLGINVDGCALCGRTSVAGFSFVHGGFVCREHMTSRDVRMDAEDLKTLRHLVKCPVSGLDKLHSEPENLKKVIPVFETYLDDYTGIRLKTRTFAREFLEE